MAVRVGRQIPRGQGNDRKDSLINGDFFVPNFSYCPAAPVWRTSISHKSDVKGCSSERT